MSARAALFAGAFLLSACANVESFEQELDGASVAAWALCKREFLRWRVPIETAPDRVVARPDQISFEWTAADSLDYAGPMYCVTTGDGTEIIEERSRTGF